MIIVYNEITGNIVKAMRTNKTLTNVELGDGLVLVVDDNTEIVGYKVDISTKQLVVKETPVSSVDLATRLARKQEREQRKKITKKQLINDLQTASTIDEVKAVLTTVIRKLM